jgi:hypothetical protein
MVPVNGWRGHERPPMGRSLKWVYADRPACGSKPTPHSSFEAEPKLLKYFSHLEAVSPCNEMRAVRKTEIEEEVKAPGVVSIWGNR